MEGEEVVEGAQIPHPWPHLGAAAAVEAAAEVQTEDEQH